ncbi:hypothetical protein JCM8547_005093 [Rhodosporidiobolus lusitaniae]
MDCLLLGAKESLRKYRKDKPPPAELSVLSKHLETASRADLASSLAVLPQELLLLIADLVKPTYAFASDDEDLAALAKEQLEQHVPPLLALAVQLTRLLPEPTDPPNREDLDLRARLLLVFGRYTSLSSNFANVGAQAISIPLSSSLLQSPPSLRLPLLRHILSTSLPVLFKPHPSVNPSTGRVLSRPLGGHTGMQSWYSEAEQDTTSWRTQAGVGAVVKLVIEALMLGEVEDLWPFLLPPLLAYLDDYEARTRIVGTALLNSLLDRVDASLLRRTGVGKVFEKSLTSCLTTLSDPLTPLLLSHAHPVAFKLLQLQYPPPPSFTGPNFVSDEPRFTALCTLLSSSILHAWEFKPSHVEIETVTARALQPILDALGAGSVRYLQVLIPHLSELLGTTATGAGGTWTIETVAMMEEAARALEGVARNGRLRIARWEGRIVGAVGKAWTGVEESMGAAELRRREEGKEHLEQLEEALQAVVKRLAEVGGTGGSSGVERMRAADPVFSTLVAAAPPTVVAG